jgi:hypothetical protein
MSPQSEKVNSERRPPYDFNQINKGVERTRLAIQYVMAKIGAFKLLDESLVPEGLKQIARSMSWLIEQIVVQNIRKYKDACGITSVDDPPHSLAQYDCILHFKDVPQEYLVNIKTSLSITRIGGRSDISKGPKLVELYETNPNAVLIVAIVKVTLEGVVVSFDDLVLFNVAWTPDPYYNRANHNLQSICNGTQTPRTNQEFVAILSGLMKEAGHHVHY